jgi:hypothetical protein
MFLMWADTLRGQVGGGWAYGEFFGPCEMASSRQASAIWGPKNSVGRTQSIQLKADSRGHDEIAGIRLSGVNWLISGLNPWPLEPVHKYELYSTSSGKSHDKSHRPQATGINLPA